MKLSSLRLLLSSGTLAAALLFTGCGGGGHKATPVAFSQTTLQAATEGTSYSQTLTVSGGTAPYTWTVSSGSLPSGMTLSSSGVLSGTPTASGSFTFSITVTDSSNPVQSLTASYTLLVAGGGPIAISLPSLPAGTVGVAYSQTLTATGGTSPYTWAVSSGSLPAGLTLSTAGVLSGTPTATGSFTFSITVTDSSSPAQTITSSYTLIIAAPQISITAPSLPAGTENVAYSQTLTASGGVAPYTWTVSSGSLPAGLTLSTVGVLSGTPTVSGTFTFSITVTDSGTPAQTHTSSYTLTIAAPTLAITAPSLPAGTVDVAYSQTLVATGGTAPFTWTLASGTLPAGLRLSSAGVLSGTPITAGISSFALTVTDSGTPVQTATTATLTLTIAPAPLTGTALLQGQYFFKVDLFADDIPTVVEHEVYVGSLTFDGAGNITAGESDYSDDDYDVINEIVTGTYTINSDGRGTMTLNLSSAGTQVYAIAVGAESPGAVATRARLVKTDGATDYELSGTDYAAGFLQLQDPTAFTPATLLGTSVFGWSGDTEVDAAEEDLPQQGGLALVGQIVVGDDGNFAAPSSADIATNETTDTNFALTGSVAPDLSAIGSSTAYASYGRALLNLTTVNYPNGQLPAQSVIYVIDANTSFVVSYPYNQYEPLFSGYMVKQQTSAFSAASLNGAAIAHGASTAVNSQASYAEAATIPLYGTSEAFVSRYSADGAGNLNTVTDANIAGSTISAQTNTLTYTVAASGRTTFSGAASPILWLSGTNAGFALTQPPAMQPLLLTLDPQQTITWSTAAIAGNLMVGVQDLASNFATLSNGEAQVDSSGNVTGTLDIFSDGGAQYFGGNALTEVGVATIDSTGQLTLTGTYDSGGTPLDTEDVVYYMISPTTGFGVDLKPGNLSPAIMTIEPGVAPAPAPPPCTPMYTGEGTGHLHPDC